MPTEAKELTRLYLNAALDAREEDALAVLTEALADGIGLDALCDDVLRPAAAEIGERWHIGEISVADEHQATAMTLRMLARLEAEPRPRHESRATIVLACPQEEMHDMGVRMAAEVLRSSFDVRLLGAQTPPRDLAQYVRDVNASAVGLSCASPLSVPSLWQAIEALREHVPETAIVIAGGCVDRYPALLGASGADAACARLAEAVTVFEELVKR